MTKTLTRHGNSLALVIDKPILEQMGVDETTPLTLACAILFFKINRASYSITEEEAVELTVETASGNMDKGAVTAFFRKHLKLPNS